MQLRTYFCSLVLTVFRIVRVGSGFDRELLKLGHKIGKMQEAGLLKSAVRPRQDLLDVCASHGLQGVGDFLRSEPQETAGLLGGE